MLFSIAKSLWWNRTGASLSSEVWPNDFSAEKSLEWRGWAGFFFDDVPLYIFILVLGERLPSIGLIGPWRYCSLCKEASCKNLSTELIDTLHMWLRILRMYSEQIHIHTRGSDKMHVRAVLCMQVKCSHFQYSRIEMFYKCLKVTVKVVQEWVYNLYQIIVSDIMNHAWEVARS